MALCILLLSILPIIIGTYIGCDSISEMKMTGKDKQENIIFGIVLIATGIILGFGVSTTINAEWKIENETFLSTISEEYYLLQEQNTYIYKEKTPTNDKKIVTIESTENTQVNVEQIAEGEDPYMVKYRRQGWILTEEKYVFYVPDAPIEEVPEEQAEK